MFQQFYPREDYPSAYEIPFELYYQKGYRGILFDIDNTLVEHDQPATARAVRLFEHLRELGFETCVISNNKDYRVKPFADAVRTQYVYKADKPSPKGYQEDAPHEHDAGDDIVCRRPVVYGCLGC